MINSVEQMWSGLFSRWATMYVYIVILTIFPLLAYLKTKKTVPLLICYLSVFYIHFMNLASFFKPFLQSGHDAALHQGCFSNPEDLPHGGGETVVPYDPTGHHHHPGLHQGHTDPPQIQTGQCSALTTTSSSWVKQPLPAHSQWAFF